MSREYTIEVDIAQHLFEVVRDNHLSAHDRSVECSQ